MRVFLNIHGKCILLIKFFNYLFAVFSNVISVFYFWLKNVQTLIVSDRAEQNDCGAEWGRTLQLNSAF